MTAWTPTLLLLAAGAACSPPPPAAALPASSGATADGAQSPTDFWSALGQLDLAAARQAACNEDERRCVAALDKALRGGSRAAADDLVALGAAGLDATVRDWARKSLLDLLRLESRWDRLASLRTEHPELELRATAIPPAMLAFPVPSVEVAATPAVLPLVTNANGFAAVAVRAKGTAADLSLTAIVDTGAGTCAIDRDAAERLGVRLLEVASLPVIGITGARSHAQAGVLPELRFGSIEARNVPIAVVDPAQLRTVVGDVPFILGWEILQHAVVEIAGAKGELVVRRSEVAPAAAPMPNLVLLHEPCLRLHSGAEPMLFLLDTGSCSTVARATLAQRMGWPTIDKGREVLRGLGGERETAVRRIEKLPLTCNKVELALGGVAAVDAPPTPREFLRIDGTLGIDVAFAIRLVIDGPNRSVEFRVD